MLQSAAVCMHCIGPCYLDIVWDSLYSAEQQDNQCRSPQGQGGKRACQGPGRHTCAPTDWGARRRKCHLLQIRRHSGPSGGTVHSERRHWECRSTAEQFPLAFRPHAKRPAPCNPAARRAGTATLATVAAWPACAEIFRNPACE